MSEAKPIQLPYKFSDLTWVALPNGALVASYDDKLKLMVGGQEVNGRTRFMSMVLIDATMETQVVAFYANTPEDSKQLAYALATFVRDDLDLDAVP